MSDVVMSYGLGVDSTAILLRWLSDPESRDFRLADLTLVTAMTGDEWDHTKRDVEEHVLPLLRGHGIRFVQVARAQRYVRGMDDVRVLADGPYPGKLHLAGDYRLSDEMREAGTIPQVGGARLCSVHAKGDVLDPTIAWLTKGKPYRHIVGFEANEMSRARKDTLYNTSLRTGEYPLIDWGWDRQTCVDYIKALTGVEWQKSACVYCPFSLSKKESRERQLELYARDPKAGADALMVEHVALALNPAQGLLAGKPLRNLIRDQVRTTPDLAGVLSTFRGQLREQEHAIYEVRRILRPRKDDPTKMANAARAIKMLERGSQFEMVARMGRLHGEHASGAVGSYWADEQGIARFYLEHRGKGFPTREHFFVVAPAVVHDKQHAHFDEWWANYDKGASDG